MYGRLAVNTRLANSRSKNLAKDLAEEDASTKTLTVMPAKDLTGMHAKDLAEVNVSIKTLTGSRSREGIGTDEPRFGGLEEPMYDRLVVNTRLANSLSKNHAETDASNKNLTGMHAKGLAEVNASTKTPTGMLAKDLAEVDASTKTLTGILAKDLTGMHAKEVMEKDKDIELPRF